MAPIPVSGPGGGPLLAFVDQADYDRLARFRWRLLPSGYVVRRQRHHGGRRVFYLHREVVGATHGDRTQVEHENGNKLDNRRANLRVRPVSSPPSRPRERVAVAGAWSPVTSDALR